MSEEKENTLTEMKCDGCGFDFPYNQISVNAGQKLCRACKDLEATRRRLGGYHFGKYVSGMRVIEK